MMSPSNRLAGMPEPRRVQPALLPAEPLRPVWDLGAHHNPAPADIGDDGGAG